MPVDPIREMERTPISSPESLRVRCPHCRKLYLVQFSDIQEAKPRFECAACHDRFWISLAEMDFSTEVDGLPVQVKEPPKIKKEIPPVSVPGAVVESDPCPKCFKLTPSGLAECIHCEVVIAKARKDLSIEEPLPPHSAHLEKLWQAVISAYDSVAAHDEFFRAAQSEGNLGYAAALYGQMLKLMPMDEVTQSRVAQIKAVGSTMLPPREPSEERFVRKAFSRLWLLPLLGGVICLGVGMALPAFRNIAGVGAAFLFLAVAMRRF